MRSPKHLFWVRSLGCGIPGCHGTPIHAHHVRNAANSGMGVKPGDQFVVNLCGGGIARPHHQRLHQDGAKTFQRENGVDLMDHAMWLAAHSPDPRIRAHSVALASPR